MPTRPKVFLTYADALGRCVWPFLSSCWVAFGRPSYLWAVLPGVPRHWRFPPASGGHPPRLIHTSGGWVYCLAPQKGKCRRGRRYLGPYRTRVGFGPATGPTLKMALCRIRALVGRIDKYQRSSRTLSGATRLHEARVLRYRGCTHLTATSRGRFNLFLRTFLRAIRGLLLQVGVSLAIINDQSK